MEATWILIVISITIAAMAVVGLFWLARAKNNYANNDAQNIGELMGLIKAMGEANALGHEQLRRTLEERLEAASKRLGDGLSHHTEKTGDAMKQVHERLAVIDVAQKNLTDLSTQVVGLQDILSNKQARGAFGEVQLENLVQDALPPGVYGFQETLSNGRRADCVLHLPNPPGSIVIDSKFPLESYRALVAATDDDSVKIAGRSFSSDVKKHIVDIAEKYIIPGETAESALMFLPSEAVYGELHANFQNLVDESQRRRVYIVSPSTV
ncbi:MAG: DNA recombination protein RmuC, partial [Rhodospirillaceae bacterium]|nr:DNA recombination protein RmuC [Rhodospirillaceae bacterium]